MRHLLISCEHAGNEIPSNYKSLFRNYKNLLNSHRGYDAGALDLALYFSKNIPSAFYYTDYSRLLVDTNRSLHNSSLFSEVTGNLEADEKTEIIDAYYISHRKLIYREIEKSLHAGAEILHIAVHSFVPELHGKIRNADIGLLYDPSRKSEKKFCSILKKILNEKQQELRIKMNYPYRGTADGLTTYLRKLYKKNYTGIELEMNQKLLKKGKFPEDMKRLLRNALKEILSADSNEKIPEIKKIKSFTGKLVDN